MVSERMWRIILKHPGASFAEIGKRLGRQSVEFGKAAEHADQPERQRNRLRNDGPVAVAKSIHLAQMFGQHFELV